jgi:hypothetical protein
LIKKRSRHCLGTILSVSNLIFSVSSCNIQNARYWELLPLSIIFMYAATLAWRYWQRIIGRREELVDVDSFIEADVAEADPVLSESVV